MHAQAWPKPRGAAKSGGNLYRQLEFGLVAAWASNPEAIMYQSAIEISKGSQQVPRDILMMASFGTFYDVYLPDGTKAESYRMVAPNAQLILDQVTDVPGSILIRLPIGWVGLAPGNNGQVLTAADSVPQWADASGGAGGGAGAALASPYLSDPNRYASVVTFGNGSVIGQALIANRIYFLPIGLPIDRTLTAIAVKVQIASALSKIRLGLFQNDHPGGGPGTLLYDGGEVDTSTTGTKIAAINQPLNPGLYWAAAWSSGTPSVFALAQSWTVGGNGWDFSAATPNTATVLTRNQAFGPPFSSESLQTHTVGGVTNTPLIGVR